MKKFYWLAGAALALGAGATLLVYWLLRSRHGLALTAVRDSETAAASVGVSVLRVKWLVFILSAIGCGMTGALIYITKLRISPDAAFSLDWTVTMFFVVVIGGIGTLVTVADTGHAFGIKTDDGVEVLVHVGIDTVQMEGKGFNLDVAKDQRVEAGDLMATVDLEAIKAAGYDTTTIVVVINTATLSEVSPVAGGDVSNGDPVINVVA